MKKKFLRTVGRYILPAALTALVRSLRIYSDIEALPHSCVIAFWHGDMIAGWHHHRRNACAMVSESEDGSLLSSVLERWGIETLRGSSSRGGSSALADAVERVKAGKRLLITPDGPRGPRRIMKIGALIAAQRAQVPLVFAEMKYQRSTHLKSWDKFSLPHPFSRVIISYKIFSPPSRAFEGRALDEELEKIQNVLSSSL